MTYKVRVKISRDGWSFTETKIISFSHETGGYGNGYHMAIRTGGGVLEDSYDIRYDKRFDPDNVVSYIAQFYSDQFPGGLNSHGDERYKLSGIDISEIEE